MIFTNRYRSLGFVRWLIAPILTALLVVLLVQPGDQPIINTGIQEGPPSLERNLFFISGHIVLFTLLVMLWRWTLAPRFIPASALLLATLIALVIGASTEFAQAFVPGRGSTWIDLLANGIGIVLALVAVRLWEAGRGDLPGRPFNQSRQDLH